MPSAAEGDVTCRLSGSSNVPPTSPCPIRSDRQTTSLPVADNWIDEDAPTCTTMPLTEVVNY